MTPQLKLWAVVGGLVVGAFLLRRRAAAAVAVDPSGLVGVCVTAADGTTACGGDDTGGGGPWSLLTGAASWLENQVTWSSNGSTGGSGWSPSTVTKGDEQTPGAWTADPPR